LEGGVARSYRNCIRPQINEGGQIKRMMWAVHVACMQRTNLVSGNDYIYITYILFFFFLAETFYVMLQISWSILFNLGLINIHYGGEYFGSWLGQQLF